MPVGQPVLETNLAKNDDEREKERERDKISVVLQSKLEGKPRRKKQHVKKVASRRYNAPSKHKRGPVQTPSSAEPKINARRHFAQKIVHKQTF